MRCQCLTSYLLRWCVGEHVVVKVRRSLALLGLFTSFFLSVREFNPSNALVYGFFPSSKCYCLNNISTFNGQHKKRPSYFVYSQIGLLKVDCYLGIEVCTSSVTKNVLVM